MKLMYVCICADPNNAILRLGMHTKYINKNKNKNKTKTNATDFITWTLFHIIMIIKPQIEINTYSVCCR